MQGPQQFYSWQVYHKILKISPSMYKPPRPVTQKNLHKIAPPNTRPPGACTWKIALKLQSKTKQKW